MVCDAVRSRYLDEKPSEQFYGDECCDENEDRFWDADAVPGADHVKDEHGDCG